MVQCEPPPVDLLTSVDAPGADKDPKPMGVTSAGPLGDDVFVGGNVGAAPKSLAAEASSTFRLADGKTVSCYNDSQFAEIRRRCGLSEDFLLDQFEFSPEFFKSQGGKGGELMCWTRDRKFIVKQLSAGDHATLLDIAGHYVVHVLSGKTFLTLIPLHFEYEGRQYMVMISCLAKSVDGYDFGIGAEGFDALYDLKGCADDKLMMQKGKKIVAVRKRIWHLWMWCGSCLWSQQRRLYYTEKRLARKWKMDGLPQATRDLIVETIRRDCEDFLIPQGLMDYSLIVATKKLVPEAPSPALRQRIDAALPTEAENWSSPLLVDRQEGSELLCVGIIDFLQRWTLIKKVAMYIKVLERDKASIPPQAYGRRFVERFAAKFVVGTSSS
ncbi:unnamed protein product [Amoebophrya sp. A25]|nr:unnamed protein product [Amoebophrya sp. A25]|eukprot:GSA25T00002875001.1